MAAFALPYFTSKVDAAHAVVRTILDNSKEVAKPSEVQHSYDDKYLLAEFLVNSSIQGISNCLSVMGLNDSDCEKLGEWSKTRSVSLRWKSEDYFKVLPLAHSTAFVRLQKILLHIPFPLNFVFSSWFGRSLRKYDPIRHLSVTPAGTRPRTIQ
jgi:hypothetical protein